MMKKLESRIEILDRLSYKWSRNSPGGLEVDTFEDWLHFYDSAATIRLMYIAMQEYSKQENIQTKEDINNITNDKYKKSLDIINNYEDNFDIKKRNWFQKKPLHIRFLIYFLSGWFLGYLSYIMLNL